MLSDQLSTLLALIDGGGNQTPIKRTANPIAPESAPHITECDKGVHLCNLIINYTQYNGYLIYTDDYCTFIWFTNSQVLKIFDLTNNKIQPPTVDEALNILELRFELLARKLEEQQE